MDGAAPIDGFEVLPHPADIGLRFWGGTLADALCAAARGLTFLLSGPGELPASFELQVSVTGEDRLDLLYAWLSEILYRFDADATLVVGCEVISANDRFVSARLRCAVFDPAGMSVPYYVKAVTFHQMALEPGPGGWDGRVYFDI
ncbi:MAG TPA: archease [Pantanalinema sp.]